VLFYVLNTNFVAGLIGLVPTHLPRSHSLHYAHAWSAVAAGHFLRESYWWGKLDENNISYKNSSKDVIMNMFNCSIISSVVKCVCGK